MICYSSFLKEDNETIFLKVFAKLSLKDLVACRLVCKSWKEIIDQNLKCKTLIVYTDVYPRHRWSFDDEPLNSAESLEVRKLNCFFRSSLTNSLLKDIQKLLLYGHLFRGQFDISALNSFAELRELEIFGAEIVIKIELPEDCKLKLEKLRFFKYLGTYEWRAVEQRVKLETPRLATIVGNLNCLELNHPEAVRVLEIRNYRKEDDLNTLVNLEHLFCERIESIGDDFLLKLQNLKTIQFFCTSNPEVLRKLHKQKADLQRTNLQIQFLGINLGGESECPEQFKDNLKSRRYRNYYSKDCEHEIGRFQCMIELDEPNYKLYLANWSRMARMIPFATRLQFKTFDLNSDKLLLFKRFTNIKEIHVNQLANPKRFLQFIQTQDRLTSLQFNRSNFKQSQFDLLCQYVPMLVELQIQKGPDSLCFDFVLNFRNLSVLKTDQFISIATVKQLCLVNGNVISVIYFGFHSNLVQLARMWASDDDWNIHIQKSLAEKCEVISNQGDLAEMLRDIESFIKNSLK